MGSQFGLCQLVGFVLLELLFKALIFSRDFQEVRDSGVEGLVGEARLVANRHRHESTKSGHSLEPHLSFSDDFRHVDMLKCGQDILWRLFSCIFCALLSWRLLFCGSFFLLEIEDRVSHWCFLLSENSLDHALVRGSCVSEMDHFGHAIVQIILVAGILRDRLLGENLTADVDACRVCYFLDIVTEVL